VEYKNKSDTSNNMGGCNRLKIIQKTPEQRNFKAEYQGTTENSHIGHRKNTSESTNVKVHNV
jgi:hypothetical protein